MITECRCGKPTRDAAYFCDDCAATLTQSLAEIPWLTDELEVTITKRKGIDYRKVGGGKGGSKEQPSPPEWGASEARANLKAVLVSWALFCESEHVRHQSPADGLPADDLPALSRWMLWRVDGLALHELGADAVDAITSAVADCRRLIDRPADRQFLGDCDTEGCSGRLYSRPGGALAKCNMCRGTVSAQVLRDKLLGELDDRLCTADDIAKLSTYLGLHSTREQVRKRVEGWGRKGRVERHSMNGQDHYRFGPVYVELARHESEGKRSA